MQEPLQQVSWHRSDPQGHRLAAIGRIVLDLKVVQQPELRKRCRKRTKGCLVFDSQGHCVGGSVEVTRRGVACGVNEVRSLVAAREVCTHDYIVREIGCCEGVNVT